MLVSDRKTPSVPAVAPKPKKTIERKLSGSVEMPMKKIDKINLENRQKHEKGK